MNLKLRLKQAEESLQQSEAFLNNVIEHSPHAMWISDDQGTLIRLNRACCDLLHITPDEVIGKYNLLQDNIVEEQGFMPLVKQVFEQGRMVRFTLRYDSSRLNPIKPAKTSLVTLDVTISPVLDGNGRVINAIVQHVDITERVQAEEALRQSEEKYRTLVENINDVIFTLDTEGRFTFISPVIERLSVYKTDEIIGRNFTEFVYPDDLPGLVESLNRTMHGKIESFEFRTLDRNGLVRYVRTSSRLNIHDGAVVGVTGVMTDITERKQAEEQLHQRNRELRLLNQVMAIAAINPEAILETTCQELTTTFDVSQVNVALLNEKKTRVTVVAGYTAIDSIPHQVQEPPVTLGQAIPVRHNPALQHLLNQQKPLVINNGSEPRLASLWGLICQREMTVALVVPLIHKDQIMGLLWLGDTRPRQFSSEEISVVESVAGQVAAALVRTKATRVQQRLATALEQSAESVMITDVRGYIVYVNSAFEHVSGYSAAEVLGQKPHILKSGRQDLAFYQKMWSTITAGKVWRGRFVNKKKDGTYYTEDAAISPVKDENGEIVNYVAVKRDITRELQLEEQYRQAQKMQAVGQLTAGIAHDFNNLLTAINGFAELAQSRGESNQAYQDMLDRILRSGRRAATLVSQLMAFSRKQVLDPQIVSLNVVVTDVEKMLQRIIGEHIILKTVLASDLGMVKVDPAQFQQVIVNLAVNARDAMPDGGYLTIETANVTLDEDYTAEHLEVQPGEYVLLAVSDNGVGMSAEVKTRIFEPFFTTKVPGQGTGLGLATVFGIVEQSGGHIWVYSEEGHGTTFKIYLPRIHEAASPVSFPEFSHDLPDGTETILVVEDDSGVRELTVRSLGQLGYTVLEAANGREAIHLIQGYQGMIHLLLTDVIMPGTNGKILAAELSKIRPNLKILFMSGYTNDAIVRLGVLESGITLLQKPFTILALARKVREMLDAA